MALIFRWNSLSANRWPTTAVSAVCSQTGPNFSGPKFLWPERFSVTPIPARTLPALSPAPFVICYLRILQNKLCFASVMALMECLRRCVNFLSIKANGDGENILVRLRGSCLSEVVKQAYDAVCFSSINFQLYVMLGISNPPPFYLPVYTILLQRQNKCVELSLTLCSCFV